MSELATRQRSVAAALRTRVSSWLAWFQSEDDVELRHRLYRAICLVASVVSFFVIIPFNLTLTLPPIVNYGTMVFGALSFALYLASRREFYWPAGLLLAGVALLVTVWFPNGGASGSILYYFFPALLHPVFFYRGWARVGWIAFVIGVGLALLGVDHLVPELATPFASAVDRTLDLVTGYLAASLLSAAILAVIVSGYRREKERLGASRSLLSAVLESSGDLVWLVDPQSLELRMFNRHYAERVRRSMGGTPRVGMPLEQCVAPERLADWRGYYRRAREEGSFSVEYALHGGSDTYLVSFSPVRHGEDLLGIAVFAKDISDAKRAEVERERMALRLVEAQKMESLGRLAGGVAHDFNNMLAGIMGYADLLQQQEQDPERKADLEAILRAAARSSELTRKMLAFARRGKNVVEGVDLNVLVHETVEMIRPSLRADVKVVLEPGATWTVDGDPSQMSQVLLNLLGNANEAMPSGGTLRVRTTDRVLSVAEAVSLDIPAGDYASLAVSDTGVGMNEEIRARIFEPFFTTKPRLEQSGTGLGLSTVYGVVHLHHGAIGVESSPGHGACFTILLPRGRLPTDRPVPQALVSPGTGLLLVVDDEPLLRSFLAKALSRLGYSAITAEDGDEGVKLFREHHHDLRGVLLDLKMPRLGGAQAFEQMRHIDAGVPILVCSGYGDNEEAQDLISRGARGLLPKPLQLKELAKQLELLTR
jgi:signal transduction histidine kinase/CheY-like chemotaxis protein